MSTYHLNEPTTGGRAPRLTATGFLEDSATIEGVAKALEAVGVGADRLYFLEGDGGVAVLEEGGTRLSRLFEDGVREEPLAALRAGLVAMAVVGVEGDDVDLVQAAMERAGVGRRRYFGRWSNNAYR